MAHKSRNIQTQQNVKLTKNRKRKAKYNLPPLLPFDGEKLDGLPPSCVGRRCSITIGLDASLADDERFLVIGPKSSRFRYADIALHTQEEEEQQQHNSYESNIETFHAYFRVT